MDLEEKFKKFLEDISNQFAEFEKDNDVILSSEIAYIEVGKDVMLYNNYRYAGEFVSDKRYINEEGKIWYIGQTVEKRSGKPFKNDSKEDVIESFGGNPQSPHNCLAAFLKDSQTFVNISLLESI